MRVIKGDFPFLKERGHVIALVGAGGKTTLMYALAEAFAGNGMNVLVTTTTHILRPEQRYWAENEEEVKKLWQQGMYAVVGEPCKNEKLKAVSEEKLSSYMQIADIVLMEADGAKRKPCKVPAAQEPVIPPECDIVIGVMGMDALGNPLKEVCFRKEEAEKLLHISSAEHLRPEHMARILSSPGGTRKHVGGREYYVVLNKCDTRERIRAGEQIAALLKEQGIHRVVLTDCTEKLIVVRGGGDLATGTIHRLWSAGLPVLVLETQHPAAIRRKVSICEAVYDGETVVDGMQGVRIRHFSEAKEIIAQGKVPVLVDPRGESIEKLRPSVVIDAILAKKNLGTKKAMAPLTIALGPGFEAGRDVDVVIETMRGHDLGRVIQSGSALPDTGIPGMVGGYTKERVIHAETAGEFHHICKIGDLVEAGQEIAQIEREDGSIFPVCAAIPGILRGIIKEGYLVTEGLKIADIDPRQEEQENCFTISDKARCIAGSVLEVIIPHYYW